MDQTSLSSSRLVTIISILLINPLPLISVGHPEKTWKLAPFSHNDNLFAPKEAILFQGLLGCKYDWNICSQNEACFDDDLFGQCWDGHGSPRKAFALQNGLDDLSRNQILALEYTIEFLNHYHLDWKDYMTQCILGHILTIDYSTIDRYRLELFYKDCLENEEVLDQVKEEKFHRRAIQRKNRIYHHLDSALGVPLFMQINGHTRYSVFGDDEPEGEYFIDEKNIMSARKPDESIMNEPTKLSIHMNEGHPGLLEVLHINNNKQVLLPSNQKTTHENVANNNQLSNSTDAERYFTVETARGYILINRNFKDQIEGARLLAFIAQINSWPIAIFSELNTDQHLLTFQVVENAYRINASNVANSALNDQKLIESQLGIQIIDSGIGNPNRGAQLSIERLDRSRLAILTLITCALVLIIMGGFIFLYFLKRNDRIRNKLAEITGIKGSSIDYYEDLCRQRMQEQPTRRISTKVAAIQETNTTGSRVKHQSESSSARSSTSSWPEEPVTTVNMDIMTGHLILSYMEDHLRDRHRLESEWQALCSEESTEDLAACSDALAEVNEKKNRYSDCIPYDHSRIRLVNDEDEDYINASKITDTDPKCKYIATQGPMPNTTNAFWQMVWEQGSCVIVALTRPIENGMTMCHHYWPVEGSKQFNDFEVNLVSEHLWSDDYVVRSFYLRNLQTMETRTVTQFHFLTWDELSNPPSAKSVLDFRRKVNKCFRGRSSPIIIHCNDGVGRTGTYILLDIVLNRICKGAREINIAATLEHIRDQRAKMVKTKEQFEFVFVAVAEEVTNLLQALPQ